MTEDLRRRLQAERGVLNPAVQMRVLLEFGRDRDWAFETAWRWSFERVRMPHDTTARKEWRAILGLAFDDERLGPSRQREMWRRAYEREQATKGEQGVGKLLIAA